MHLILHWLSWDPGSGQIISIGNDRILGLDAHLVLSLPLVTALNQKNIFSLAQAKGLSDSHHFCNYWFNNSDLGLSGDLASEWDQYIRVLIDSEILLQDRADVMMWIGGDKSGVPTVKIFYWGIVSTKKLKMIDS
jgi:hypothetical protein